MGGVPRERSNIEIIQKKEINKNIPNAFQEQEEAYRGEGILRGHWPTKRRLAEADYRIANFTKQ